MITPQSVVDRVAGPLADAQVRVARAGDTPVTPCAVVGMPAFEWKSYAAGLDPSELTCRVVLLAGAGESTVDELGELLTRAVAALDRLEWCTLRRAAPVVYSAAGGPTPAYELELELDPEEDW